MTIATHNGPFHADDLLATALLLHIYPDAEVVRTRDQDVLDSCDIVYDVGGEYNSLKQRYDHHMDTFDEKYDNGIILSSLGLLWREYGLQYCDSNAEVAKLIEERLVMAIDGPDNGQNLYDVNEYGVQPVSLYTVLKSFYPAYGEEEDFDDAFQQALPLAKKVLERTKAKYAGVIAARDEFRVAYTASPSKQYVMLDKGMPFGEEAEKLKELLYVCFPIRDGEKYMIRAIALSPDSFDCRKKFPEAWAGLNDEALEAASGIPNASFCHKGRWLAGATTREAALAMITAAIDAD